ncbi:hypothetical protein BDV96DRAFT_568365 [Lophiotrema nucula]|uniref:Uncharacterized protein n=1 Tax=Lophiotrema nucula TaxID=690887 RepID=A0A6A5ZKD7_9PLEO|nr:hypothetical protein BDV96DRAFT_568365 [Lophiotrema nucula]
MGGRATGRFSRDWQSEHGRSPNYGNGRHSARPPRRRFAPQATLGKPVSRVELGTAEAVRAKPSFPERVVWGEAHTNKNNVELELASASRCVKRSSDGTTKVRPISILLPAVTGHCIYELQSNRRMLYKLRVPQERCSQCLRCPGRDSKLHPSLFVSA